MQLLILGDLAERAAFWLNQALTRNHRVTAFVSSPQEEIVRTRWTRISAE